MSDSNPLILLVDDDLFTAELTGMVLEMSGYGVLIAEGGFDALEKLAATPAIAMVISDMNMPFMDGLELFAEIRQQGLAQPFVLLTGDDAEPLKAAHPELDAVITKDEHLQDALPELLASLL